MKHFTNRLFAMLLALAMIFGMLPVAAFAAETDESEAEVIETVEEVATEETAAEETVAEEATTEETAAEETVAEEATTEETVAEEAATEETAAEEIEDSEEIVNEDSNDESTLVSETGSEHSLTIASSTVANLAPGVTETTVVSYDKNGDRVQYFVVNANIASNSTVQVKANYHDNDNTGVWGKATVVEQANAAKEKRGYNVVATTNASYYNVSTGQPTGAFFMEGVNINGNSAGDAYNFFAVMKDGTAMIGKKGTFSQYADNVQEAVGGWTMLVWEGAVAEGLNATNKYPRSTVGIKANGDVILLLADGNNKPYSAGLTYAEQAQLMLELGCEYAVELDGGGSATYAAKLEGSDEIEVRNVCCDGTVRSVSNTLMVISTAVADGTFDHANLSTEYAFYAPNSAVEIQAVGADAAGGAAEIPEDITWALSDDSFGTVANGVFTSNGKLGTVTVQMKQGENVVGTVDVTVVNPTSIAFSADEKTVPYGKTSDFTITAMYNGAEMFAAPSAYDFVASAGSMNGFIYTAPADEAVASATVTATYKYAELNVITVDVIFGKGSELLFNFEDGDLSEWTNYDGLLEAAKNGAYTGGYTDFRNDDPNKVDNSNSIEPGMKDEIFLAKKSEGGKTYSGEYSLGFTIDYTQHQSHANWMYDYLFYLGDTITYRDVENGINGTRLGMWMYIPEEAVGLCARLAYNYKDANGKESVAYLYFTYQYVTKGFSKLTSDKIPEAGWAYVYCNLDDISSTYVTSSYYAHEDGTPVRDPASNYAPAFIQFIVSSSAKGAEKCTVYIDDITLDYSDVVDDRDAPLVTNPKALDDQNTYAMGSTLNFNTVSFTADVAEDTSHGTNYTGLNAATAQIYVDGQKVATNYSAGKISATGVVLPNGTHDVTFEIADNQGNYTKLTKQIVIAAEASYPVITVTGEPLAVNAQGKLYTGGQYNIQVKTDKVEAIDTVTTKIWLNSASTWALEHMTALEGFEATYVLDEKACTATITITRKDDVTATGEAVLATIPVYAWFWDGTTHKAQDQWSGKNGGGGCAPQVTVSYDAKYGEVTYTDAYAVDTANYVSGFGSARKDVATELDSSIANLKNTIGEWHYHTAEAIADADPTCTVAGYEGRTACTVCKSVIDWGTDLAATGHTYETTDGVLKCGCGKLFNGVFTDGKEYVDGVVLAGWVGESYYVDGVKVTGIQNVEGLYYDFGEDGISKGKLTGTFTLDGKLYNAVLGELKSGWHYENEKYYYFSAEDFAAVDGIVEIDGYNYEFEGNVLIDGHWIRQDGKIYFKWAGHLVCREWMTIKGKTYHFDQYGVAATGMQRLEKGTYSGVYEWYLFDENGVFMNDYTGMYLYADNGSTYYFVDGIRTYAGLIEVDGSYYYVNGSGKVVMNGDFSVSKTNGLMDADVYTFDAEGKMVLPEAAKNGIYFEEDGVYYYNNGKLYRAGLVLHEGAYYYFNSSGKAVVGVYGISATNGLMPAGVYTFGEDGKMIMPEPEKNGVYEEDGRMRYYVDGEPTKAGFVEHEGVTYYFGSNGYAITGMQRLETAIGSGAYETYLFDENGVFQSDFTGMYLYADNGSTYYFVDGIRTYAGLIEVDGSYYYVNGNGKVVMGGDFSVSKTNGLKEAGVYTFDAEGKMVIPTEVKNGIYFEEDGVYYYKNGRLYRAGLVEHEGDYYYFNSSGKAVTGVYGISATNGLMEPGAYTFGPDGKMIIPDVVKNGIYFEADGVYYYKDGRPYRAGLVEHEGDYYYFNSSGKAVAGVYGISATNGLMAPGAYTFGPDGKMIR